MRESKWPTPRELAKSHARSARKNWLGLQARRIEADFAFDLAVALGVQGDDVRWLRRFCRGVREEVNDAHDGQDAFPMLDLSSLTREQAKTLAEVIRKANPDPSE